jgi:hypothetical protein
MAASLKLGHLPALARGAAAVGDRAAETAAAVRSDVQSLTACDVFAILPPSLSPSLIVGIAIALPPLDYASCSGPRWHPTRMPSSTPISIISQKG